MGFVFLAGPPCLASMEEGAPRPTELGYTQGVPTLSEERGRELEGELGVTGRWTVTMM